MDKFNYSFKKTLQHFEKSDPKMAELITSLGETDFRLHTDHFESLAKAIISQQISVKAADSIFRKLAAGAGGKVSPRALGTMSADELRGCGLSPQKLGYISDLTSHFIRNPEIFNHLHALPDEEAVEALVSIKGIGKWTAQMFLMFTLGREDVFAPDDLGLRNAMMKLYKWKAIPDKNKMEKKATKWSPYRTVGCFYLWKSLHNKPFDK